MHYVNGPTNIRPRRSKLVIALVGVLLAIAIGARIQELNDGGCKPCGAAGITAPIGLVGVITYSILLAVLLWRGLSTLAIVILSICFGAHTFLIAVLVASGSGCITCASAFLISGVALGAVVLDRVAFRWEAAAISAATVALLQIAGPLLIIARDSHPVLRSLSGADFSGGIKPTIIAFEKAQGEMSKFRREAMPLLVREFGEGLAVEFRDPIGSQGAHDGMIIVGRSPTLSRVFPHYPGYPRLRGAVLARAEP